MRDKAKPRERDGMVDKTAKTCELSSVHVNNSGYVQQGSQVFFFGINENKEKPREMGGAA